MAKDSFLEALHKYTKHGIGKSVTFINGKSETVEDILKNKAKSKKIKAIASKKGMAVKNIKVPPVNAKDLKGRLTSPTVLSPRLKKNLTLIWAQFKGVIPDTDFLGMGERVKPWFDSLNSFKVLGESSWNDVMKSNKLDIPYPDFLRKQEVQEPDYKSWCTLLLNKIKNHNEDVQRDKKNKGSGYNPGFIGGMISFDQPPREISLPTEVKDWQEKEQESTEEGRRKIGRDALQKLSFQERKVLNLNRPYKEIDGEYLSRKQLMDENEKVLKEKKEELSKMQTQLITLRRDNPKSKASLGLSNEFQKKHSEFQALKEKNLFDNRYDLNYL